MYMNHSNNTVYEVFKRSVADYGDRPFLHIPEQATITYSGNPIDLTYTEAHECVKQIRLAYEKTGYGLGHRVALVLDNRMEFFLHFLALNALGICIVPVNSGFQPEEMNYVISHSDVCLIVSLPEHIDRVKEALKLTNKNPPVINCYAFEEIPGALVQSQQGIPDKSTEVAVLYTSGTTGKPKACMLSNDYFLTIGNWYNNLGGYCELVPGKERLITPLPLVHMNALACSTMAMIISGGCIIQLDRFHASTWWQTVQKSAATCLHYLGVMPAILLNLPKSINDDFGDQIKFGFGAGTDPKYQGSFERRFGFPLIEGWAMTETGAAACIMANKEPRHIGTRCFGRAPDYMEYRIVDEEGMETEPGEPGELLVRSAGDNIRKGFFSGYYKDPEETERVWKDEWFHTGDIVRVGTDGSFYFIDRKKNIIRRSGENIAAVEVEGVLNQYPLIESCAVVPLPDKIRGEEVATCIILKKGISATQETAERIFAFCDERLIYYKIPAYFIFMDKLPITASQKIQHGELRRLAMQLVDNGQCINLATLKRRK